MNGSVSWLRDVRSLSTLRNLFSFKGIYRLEGMSHMDIRTCVCGGLGCLYARFIRQKQHYSQYITYS